MKQVYLTVLIVLSCLVLVNAQSSGITSKKKFKCGKVDNSYNQSKNETQVQLKPLMIEGVFHIAKGETIRSEYSLPNDDHGVAMTVIHTFQGKVQPKPQSVVIVIEVESLQPRYEKERSFSLKLDGEVINIGTMDRAFQRTDLGYTRELLSITISYEQFIKIVNAKKVKIGLIENYIDLNECQLDALRKFAFTLSS